jgi:hypothetical protein
MDAVPAERKERTSFRSLRDSGAQLGIDYLGNTAPDGDRAPCTVAELKFDLCQSRNAGAVAHDLGAVAPPALMTWTRCRRAG